MTKCDKCEREATHIQEYEPFLEEIRNMKVMVNYCDICWRESIQEI